MIGLTYSLCSKASFLRSSLSNSPTLKVGETGTLKSKFASLDDIESSIPKLGCTAGDTGEYIISSSVQLCGVRYSDGIHPS